MSTGLEDAGFTPILFSEIDKDARNTFLLNRNYCLGNVEFKELDDLHVGDVMALDDERLEKYFRPSKIIYRIWTFIILLPILPIFCVEVRHVKAIQA